jgi:hypothetical protein
MPKLLVGFRNSANAAKNHPTDFDIIWFQRPTQCYGSYVVLIRTVTAIWLTLYCTLACISNANWDTARRLISFHWTHRLRCDTRASVNKQPIWYLDRKGTRHTAIPQNRNICWS